MTDSATQRDCPLCQGDTPGYVPVYEGPDLPGSWELCPACLGRARKPLSLEAGEYWLQAAAAIVKRCTGAEISLEIVGAVVTAMGPWLAAQVVEELEVEGDPVAVWAGLDQRIHLVLAQRRAAWD